MIQNAARLSLNKGQVLLQNNDGDYTFPLEDIAAILLESPQVSLTSSLLAKCQDGGVPLITCDDTHIPNGVLLPFLPHSRQSKVARMQIAWSEPFKKRLWQRVVQTKISNQAKCLKTCKGAEIATRIFALSKLVESGDVGNVEAQAAREYWTRLFGDDFRRDGYGSINAALNYGYAVLRAFVARSQVAYGLLPTFGIHHDNELNAFNLTDDMMEVFRPLADRRIFIMQKEGQFSEDGNLSKENRAHLAALANELCVIDGDKHNVMNAADKMAAGLVTAIEGKSAALIPLPEFIVGNDVGE
ncbi:MAG: type II CRISPR-associated endonuclease Cas1 [Alphaproteobacteria bacterium]|nr:type II CRISPR-associated endonuclease Cas1 [Alphaproteobacteria bacterium]